ncbi:MAG: shikimate kinase [Treponema sp.]|nr:shikimate kinase [Treponema sp.]
MKSEMQRKSLVLMGIKHCGKSTQGRLLAKKLSLPFFDTDTLIEDATGKSPRQIYNESGADAFKDAEYEACKKLADELSAKGTDAVIATGGGICMNERAVETLRSLGKCVFLVADEKLASDRIVREAVTEEDGTLSNLPAYIACKNPSTILDVRKIFHDFYMERTKLYSRIADLCVEMKQVPKDENLRNILEAVGALKTDS